MKLLAKFRKGTTPMDSDFIEYRKDGDLIIKKQYGMGGQSKQTVKTIPHSIDGYVRLV